MSEDRKKYTFNISKIRTKQIATLFCTATRNLQNDYYEQLLEEEAENEGMAVREFTWEEYEEWVQMGKQDTVSKKDHSKFIQQVKDNELSKDDIVKYLEENL